MKISKKILSVTAGLVLTAGITTSAVASIPDNDDHEFHACVPNTGTLRSVFLRSFPCKNTCSLFKS